MVNNFFDLVKDSFFNPLSGGNKRINYEILSLLNKKLSLERLQASKEEIVEWILEYLENHPTILSVDETEEVETDNRSFAYNKINYLTRCGWLIEDYEKFDVVYQMDETGIKLLSTMENAVKDDSNTQEFSGFVYGIYLQLKNFKTDHSVEIIEQVGKLSKELNDLLRGINVNIRKYLNKLIKENEAQPKKILTDLFEYQRKVILRAFKNFREIDNPSKYKLEIDNKVDELLSSEFMKDMVANYIKIKFENVYNENNESEAKAFFENVLLSVRDQFEEIEENLNILNKRNTNYISTARSRLQFLLNEETDIEGRIISCLKGLGSVSDEFFDESHFSICSGSNLDEFSLYVPSIKKNKPEVQIVEEQSNLTFEEVNNLMRRLYKENEYSVSNIKKFIDSALGEKDMIEAKNIVVENFSDVLKLFLAQVYSMNSNINYRIRYLDDTFIVNKYKLKNFIIERKEKYE